MDYTTLAETIEQSPTLKETDVLSLYEAFEQVTDGRKKGEYTIDWPSS